jgi:hypothetical protein
MIRLELIERIKRAVYNGFPTDDANVTDNLINSYINDAIAVAAKNSYVDSIKLDGIAYVNNSFYTTFKNISVVRDENFIYKMQLPEIPIGVGKNEGIATLQLKNNLGDISKSLIPISLTELSFVDEMKPLPNTILYWNEGSSVYLKSTTSLVPYKGIVRMISGGDSNNLNSVLNVPNDSIPLIFDYVFKILMTIRGQQQDTSNDGQDIK